MPSSAITFEDVKQLTLTSSSLSRTFIIDAMELAYYGSATAQKLMDDWAATGKNILVGYKRKGDEKRGREKRGRIYF